MRRLNKASTSKVSTTVIDEVGLFASPTHAGVLNCSATTTALFNHYPHSFWHFKAEINFAEESGVVQVETFGVSLNAEGTCFYGMQVRHGEESASTVAPEHNEASHELTTCFEFTFGGTTSGRQVEAVMDRIKDNISLDHMARLLVDVQQDSSGIVDSIISQHQRELLNLIFLGDAPNRNKVTCLRWRTPLAFIRHRGTTSTFMNHFSS